MHRRRSRRTLIAVLLVALVVTTGALFIRPTTISYTAASGAVVTADGTYTCGPTTTGGFDCEPLPSPSGSPSAGPTPSASPSATPTPTPTTPAPTTPPPTTPAPTPTPTASPTPTSSAPTACLPKPSACGLPDATNTGVPAGTVLTASSGDFTVRTAGAVIDGMDISGCVTIAASNVVIRNSRIRCAGPYGVFNDTRNTATGLVVTNVEVDCLNNAGTTAIAGHNFAATAVNLHGCENGLDMGNNTSVQASYIHGLFLGSGGHTDGIQSGGQGVLVKGNTIINDTNGGTSTIITDPTSTANWTISGNLLDNNGGSYVLYCPKSTVNFVVTGNRFAWANAYGYDYNGQCGGPAITWSGNVLDATGAALAP